MTTVDLSWKLRAQKAEARVRELEGQQEGTKPPTCAKPLWVGGMPNTIPCQLPVGHSGFCSPWVDVNCADVPASVPPQEKEK
jgi:hypothetical protein